jgi:hypothetical protein
MFRTIEIKRTDRTITSVQRLPLDGADGKLLWVKCGVNIRSVTGPFPGPFPGIDLPDVGAASAGGSVRLKRLMRLKPPPHRGEVCALSALCALCPPPHRGEVCALCTVCSVSAGAGGGEARWVHPGQKRWV